MIKKLLYILLPITLFILCYNCVEEIELQSETVESVLVVEATITNELKHQIVLLTRAFSLSDDVPNSESGANIKVIDSDLNEYLFQETEPGVYKSIIEFASSTDLDYHLEIVTNSGIMYNSNLMRLTQPTSIDNLFAVRDFNENNEEGVSIYIDTYDPTEKSQYYRFEYEEAYKIIAPSWVMEDLILGTPPDEPQFLLVPRPLEERVCYNIVKSNDVIITNTLDFNEDKLDQYRIRFLNRDNYIISHRYTIEVKQYVQSREAYIFYETLKNFSVSESLFSENQVGFIEGNLFAVNQQNKKVIGFFQVSSVDIKRIYFNYEDLFPDELLPPYVRNCLNPIAPPTTNPTPSGSPCPLCDFISDGNWKYLADNSNFNPSDPSQGPYLLVPTPCGDCTTLGETEIPDFWVD